MNITVTTSDQAQVNFVNNGQSQQSPADIENNNARSSVSKRPASPSGEDNGRAKRPRDASSAPNGTPYQLQIPPTVQTVGEYLIPDIFDFQRILALPSSRADPAPANPRSAGPENQRFSDTPTPTPGETLDREMVIRRMQAGAIPGVHYTTLDMDQLVNYIVRLLTDRLNALLDQDAQGNLQPNRQVPGVVSKVNIRRRNTPEDLKKFIKWTRRDYLKEMTFPDIPAYNNRLRHFSLDGPLGISDIMELVVGVERRVQRLPAPNQGL
jgi:hypothetical protein